ncbi:MAG: ABC-type transport auxiliary lipoprotein family protein [Candidatus Hydrogenedentes bacterium]|nr:ABC-type transport auxiliary lipoprotein family protein [Candidatus Hydrogenedentota bacterium]
MRKCRFLKSFFAKFFCVCLLLLFYGCITSSKVSYFTLDVKQPLIESNGEKNICLEVVSIKLSEPLKRKEIMFRSSSVEIGYYSEYLWASSIEEMVALRFNKYFSCPGVKIKPDYYLHIDLLNFEQEVSPEGSRAIVSMKIEILNPEDMKLISQRYYTEVEVINSEDIVETVTKLSRATDKIIIRVEKDISEYVRGSSQVGGRTDAPH